MSTSPSTTSQASLSVLRLTPHYYWPQLSDTSWPVKFDAIGGMQSQLYRLTHALDRLGVGQLVLTLRIPGAPRKWAISEKTEVCGVRVPILPLRSRIRGMVDLNQSWALGVLGYLARRRPRIDIIHVHCSGVLTPPLMGWMLCRALRVPLVLTIHCSIIATYHPMTALDRVMQPLARWVECKAVRAAARTVTLTPRTISILRRATGKPEDAFTVLPDIIDADDFASKQTPAGQDAARQRWAIPEGVRVVGYVGRIAREKGWTIILDIAEKLRNEPIHWLICGDGNERDLFEKEVRARGLQERMTITGYLPNDEISNMMGLMDLLLMASLHEEFGSVMLEAMAVGLPIIAVGVGGVADVLEHGDLGWIVPERTAGAFATGIMEALGDAEWRARTARKAAAKVRARYNLNDVAAATLALYQSVRSPRRRGEEGRPRPGSGGFQGATGR